MTLVKMVIFLKIVFTLKDTGTKLYDEIMMSAICSKIAWCGLWGNGWHVDTIKLVTCWQVYILSQGYLGSHYTIFSTFGVYLKISIIKTKTSKHTSPPKKLATLWPLFLKILSKVYERFISNSFTIPHLISFLWNPQLSQNSPWLFWVNLLFHFCFWTSRIIFPGSFLITELCSPVCELEQSSQ